VWLYDNTDFRLEGRIIVSVFEDHPCSLFFLSFVRRGSIDLFVSRYACRVNRAADAVFPQGFDEFMNVILDDAEEVYLAKPATSTKAGRDESRKRLGASERLGVFVKLSRGRDLT
jgi:hypothetical protein